MLKCSKPSQQRVFAGLAVALLWVACTGQPAPQVNAAANAAGQRPQPSSESAPPLPQSPAQADTAALSPESVPPTDANPKYANTLKWSTASEVDNFGFDVYRAEREEGPFTRINPEPIGGAGSTDQANFYQYVDDTINPYLTYYYYIESISLGNERERFTPIFPAKPKIPTPAPTDKEEGQ